MTKVIQTTCYKTSDGLLFEDDKKARDHQENILGEALDDLLPHDDRGNVTRIDRYNLLTKIMADAELSRKINAIHRAINFTREND